MDAVAGLDDADDVWFSSEKPNVISPKSLATSKRLEGREDAGFDDAEVDVAAGCVAAADVWFSSEKPKVISPKPLSNADEGAEAAAGAGASKMSTCLRDDGDHDDDITRIATNKR